MVVESGWNEEMYMEEAGKQYFEEVGEDFKDVKCVPVLHKLPKFDPMVAQINDSSLMPTSMAAGADADPESDSTSVPAVGSANAGNSHKKKKVNNTEPAQGSTMQRPIGIKKAKLLQKLEAETAVKTEFEDNNRRISNMSAATKELVDAFKANTDIKKSSVKAQRQNKWI